MSMQNEKQKLKPCPFCGSIYAPRRFVRRGKNGFRDSFMVFCDYQDGGCGASGGWYHHEGEAIEAWNMRTDFSENRTKLPKPRVR